MGDFQTTPSELMTLASRELVKERTIFSHSGRGYNREVKVSFEFAKSLYRVYDHGNLVIETFEAPVAAHTFNNIPPKPDN